MRGGSRRLFDCHREVSNLGESLLVVIVDWSDAEINGLKAEIGDKS